jgi:hypothetical protein
VGWGTASNSNNNNDDDDGDDDDGGEDGAVLYYDVGLDGDTWRVGPLAGRIYEALVAAAVTPWRRRRRRRRRRRGWTAGCAPWDGPPAREAVRAALKQNVPAGQDAPAGPADGHRLAVRGVVLVTLNYRLGALGFLVSSADGLQRRGLPAQVERLA